MDVDAAPPGSRTLSARDFVRWCFRARSEEAEPVRVHEPDTGTVGLLLTRHRGWGLLHARRDLIADAPAGLLQTAEDRTRRTLLQQMSAHADLVLLSRCLETAGVRWLLVKGPVLAELHYPRPEQRPYGDLDVLVGPQELRAAVTALESSGWVVLDRNWTLALDRMVGELHLTGPLGTLVDLHWSLQNREVRRRRLRIGTAALLDRSTTVHLRDLTVRTLDPADTLVHLCLHAAGDGADRLGQLADVAAVLPPRGPGWSDLVDSARGWGAGQAVALTLQRTAHELAVDVPASVVRRLDPNVGARLAEAAVHTLWPVSGAAEPYGPAARWTHWRLDDRGVRWRLPRRRPSGSPFVDSSDDADSVLHDAGGAAGRESYLRAVEATSP